MHHGTLDVSLLDTTTTPGTYWISEKSGESKSNSFLTIYSSGSLGITIQYLSNYNGTSLLYRIKWFNNSWSAWKELIG